MNRKGNVLAVMSPKGGVGKTVTTVNIAVALSTLFNKKILAIDTNVTTASLGFHFNMLYPKVTIYDVLRKDFSINSAIYSYNENLDIIPASIVIEERDQDINVMERNVRRLVNHYDILLTNLVKKYDLILLDSAGGFGIEAIATMQVADGLLLVTNPEYPAVVATAKSVEYAKHMGVPMGGIVLTKVRGKGYELSKHEIEEALKVKVIEEVPMDNSVPKSIALKMPVLVFNPHCRASVAYKKIAASLFGEVYKPTVSERMRSLLRI